MLWAGSGAGGTELVVSATSRGRHRSTDKEGGRTLARIEAVPGVAGVVIGHSVGGKNLGRPARTGSFRLQGQVAGGFRGVVQTSRGIQEVFVRLEEGADRPAVAAAIAAALDGR